MEKFISLRAVAAPLPEKNVNTDIIIPIKRLVGTERGTLGEFAFEPWRYGADELPNSNFVLNQPRYADAEILIAGRNFACGSSREGAVWALNEFGIRALMAPSFGAIFFNNCFQSGVLPIVLDDNIIDDFMIQARDAAAGPWRWSAGHPLFLLTEPPDLVAAWSCPRPRPSAGPRPRAGTIRRTGAPWRAGTVPRRGTDFSPSAAALLR